MKLPKNFPSLHPLVLESLDRLDFSKLTPVQKKCIPAFIAHQDVIVESPTGSGKTLAFLLPAVEILLRLETPLKKWQIGALIVAPSRELAQQIHDVLAKFLTDDCPLKQILFTSGRKTGLDVDKFKANGGNIVIGTPGRLEELFNWKSSDFNFLGHCRTLEVLIFDECDRLLEMGFHRSLQGILSMVPKQRRTGLFSATQCELMEDLAKAGLRNPVRIAVKTQGKTSDVEESDGHDCSVPSGLLNCFTIVPPKAKLSALLQFLITHRSSKMLLFFSTCMCVDYFSQFIQEYLKSRSISIQLFVIHRKKNAKRREKVIEQFRQCGKNSLLCCTDIMARGIDINDIDWVIQWDLPRCVSGFVHRSGRTARLDKEGSSVIFLMPSEEEYVDFLKRHRGITLDPLKMEFDFELADEVCNSLRERAVKNRSILETGTKAFVSFIQHYAKQDCHVVCPLKDMDVVNVAHCYGLVRMPVMREFASLDLSSFVSGTTVEIPYLDKQKEADRQKALIERRDPSIVAERRENCKRRRVKKKSAFIKGHQYNDSDMEDLEKDVNLMKRLKKGKITKEEFDEEFLL